MLRGSVALSVTSSQRARRHQNRAWRMAEEKPVNEKLQNHLWGPVCGNTLAFVKKEMFSISRSLFVGYVRVR